MTQKLGLDAVETRGKEKKNKGNVIIKHGEIVIGHGGVEMRRKKNNIRRRPSTVTHGPYGVPFSNRRAFP